MADELKMAPMLQQNKTFTTEFRGVRYEYYLTGPIGSAEDYLDLCNILRSASSQDEVVIRINCPGGNVDTGNMIINAINESEANVIGFIESECGSMATFIFLACHNWGVSEAAEFFAHTCSYGSWGKEHENFSRAEFLRKQQHKMTRKRYASFLTEEEIDRLLLGQDVYLDADEIMERLVVYAKAREMQGCGNPDCLECGEGVDGESEPKLDLFGMIKEAVREVIEETKTVPEATEALKDKPKRRSRRKELSENKELG